MKPSTLALLAALTLSGGLMAQRAAHLSNDALRHLALPAPVRVLEPMAAPRNTISEATAAQPIEETKIGETRWDDQSNASLQNRLYLFPDGTLGATWVMGFTDGSWTDRGTGYNYFDGSSWAADPTARIESQRSGWPSYAPWGANGEIIVSHTSGNGLNIMTRAQKGSGTWNQSLFSGPAGHTGLLWARMMTSGANHNTVHILGLTPPTGYSGTPYLGQDGALVYSRSTDGGASWAVQNLVLPGMDSSHYLGFASDAYAFASPKGDTLALVVGDTWHDLFLMKSTDGGLNWTRTVIFSHPYPFFNEPTTLVTDTPWVCDGGMAVALDRNGDAWVAFGLMRVLNDDLTDGNTSYFPFTDGLALWKEGEPPFSSLDIDSVDARGNLAGYMVDWNLNDTLDLLPGSTEIIGQYFLSLSGMPSLVIDPQDNKLYLAFSSLMENKENGVQHFRHTMLAAFDLNNWPYRLPQYDLTGSIVHNFSECVYPTFANRTIDPDVLALIYQSDEEPGLASWGDLDAPTDNSIIFHKELVIWEGLEEPPLIREMKAWPNPCGDEAVVEVALGRAAGIVLEVYDIQGRRLGQYDRSGERRISHQVRLDLGGRPAGVYLVKVSGAGASASLRLIRI
ncbi:MAG TPA: T9SS type A sorting domain-containing protein [Bacteroidales bacterium]|nr:T9SS type A sorting domain-containing protein [Bacteroidales bacterium]